MSAGGPDVVVVGAGLAGLACAVHLHEAGAQAIPDQIAARLPAGTVRLGARAAAVAPREVRLDSGETVAAEAVVVATEGPEAARLTGLPAPGSLPVTCLYFAAERTPVGSPSSCSTGTAPAP